MSKIEDKIASIIKRDLNTKGNGFGDFQREYVFKDLKYKNASLRYDISFLWQGRRICVEVDGEQHFKTNDYFFKNGNDFKHMQENDRRKNRYCLINNIPLYRIPYWDIDKITKLKDILDDKYKVTSIYHNDNLIFSSKLLSF